jgi:hypothetical protein
MKVRWRWQINYSMNATIRGVNWASRMRERTSWTPGNAVVRPGVWQIRADFQAFRKSAWDAPSMVYESGSPCGQMMVGGTALCLSPLYWTPNHPEFSEKIRSLVNRRSIPHTNQPWKAIARDDFKSQIKINFACFDRQTAARTYDRSRLDAPWPFRPKSIKEG